MSQTMPLSRRGRAFAKLPVDLAAAFLAWRRDRAERRRAARHLHTASDHLLRDIGLTRHDIELPPRPGPGRRP